MKKMKIKKLLPYDLLFPLLLHETLFTFRWFSVFTRFLDRLGFWSAFFFILFGLGTLLHLN